MKKRRILIILAILFSFTIIYSINTYATSHTYCGDGIIQRPNDDGQYENCDDDSGYCGWDNNGVHIMDCIARGTPGGWYGCIGNGANICEENLIDPENYFEENPVCTRVTTGCSITGPCNEYYCGPEIYVSINGISTKEFATTPSDITIGILGGPSLPSPWEEVDGELSLNCNAISGTCPFTEELNLVNPSGYTAFFDTGEYNIQWSYLNDRTEFTSSSGTIHLIVKPIHCIDWDNDGYYINGVECGEVDCNDNSYISNPGEEEGIDIGTTCGDGLDNNCNGFIDTSDPSCTSNPEECQDIDGDGYGVCPDCGIANGCQYEGDDCNDNNPSVHNDCNKLGSGRSKDRPNQESPNKSLFEWLKSVLF